MKTEQELNEITEKSNCVCDKPERLSGHHKCTKCGKDLTTKRYMLLASDGMKNFNREY